MTGSLDTLTDKEKETLRLIVRGHDAKSAASALDLSVHTINERLRAARRKLDVTSSREAARLLMESESEGVDAAGPPQILVGKQLGDAGAAQSPDAPPITAPGSKRALWIGGMAMIFALSIAAALMLSNTPSMHPDASARQQAEQAAAFDAEREAAARSWLALVDAEDWQASFDAAGTTFQNPNTVETWKAASDQARGPLGEMKAREVVAIQSIASPEAYEVVQFRTDFAHREGVIESVTLEREGGTLRVVGYFIN